MMNIKSLSSNKLIAVCFFYETLLIWLYFLVSPTYLIISIFAIPVSLLVFKETKDEIIGDTSLTWKFLIVYFASFIITYIPIKLTIEFVNIVFN